MPEIGFAGVSMGVQFLGDFLQGGLCHVVVGVAGEVRASLAGDGPTGPGAPFSLFETRLSESVRIVLEVDARITEKNAWGRVLEDVDECLVGKRPGFENGLISGQIGSPGPIETENRPGRKFFSPEDLAVFQAGFVELGSPIICFEAIEISPVHVSVGRGQVGNVVDFR